MIKNDNYFKRINMNQKIIGLFYNFIECNLLIEIKEEITK